MASLPDPRVLGHGAAPDHSNDKNEDMQMLAAHADILALVDTDPQAAFDLVKGKIATTPVGRGIRSKLLQAVGERFVTSARNALANFPPLELRDGDEVRFTPKDLAAIEACTDIVFSREIKGRAGGIKALDKKRMLFFKFAFNLKTQRDRIYDSMAMAAKAAKREEAASRWVHALDSIHVNTPLLECVDLEVRLKSGGSRVIRV